jgi:regulator of sigma E protease
MRALLALLALGGLVLVHELAHLAAARVFGARAVVFSFGIGPPLFAFRALGQRWAIGALPFGGWLRLEGENPHEAPKPSGVLFPALSPGRRLAIFAAGPLGSWACAVLLLAGLFLAGTHQPDGTVIGAVEPGSPAARAHLLPGDRIVAVQGAPVATWSALLGALEEHEDTPTTLRIERGPEPLEVGLVPEAGSDGPHIGVRQRYAFRRLPPVEALQGALRHTALLLRRVVDEGLLVLAQPWGGAARAHTVGALVWQTAELAGRSGDALVRVLAALSLALALFFLLPLPALDGGRMLLTLWEGVVGRPLDARVQTVLQAASLIAGILAMAWLAYGEVRQVLSATVSG